jgi:hypothetical protein
MGQPYEPFAVLENIINGVGRQAFGSVYTDKIGVLRPKQEGRKNKCNCCVYIFQ